jgi:hypothetical protein
MSKPATEQFIVEGENAKKALKKDGPKIHRGAATNPNQAGAYGKFHVLIHS